MTEEAKMEGLADELEQCEVAPFPHALSEYYVVLVDEGLRSRILTALRSKRGDDAILDDIAEMMGEFVDNWPKPKRVSTALKLIAKTLRAALDPPKHSFWGAGEPDCPRDIKAGNGEIHTLRCKVCGQDDPRDDRCLAALQEQSR